MNLIHSNNSHILINNNKSINPKYMVYIFDIKKTYDKINSNKTFKQLEN